MAEENENDVGRDENDEEIFTVDNPSLDLEVIQLWESGNIGYFETDPGLKKISVLYYFLYVCMLSESKIDWYLF